MHVTGIIPVKRIRQSGNVELLQTLIHCIEAKYEPDRDAPNVKRAITSGQRCIREIGRRLGHNFDKERLTSIFH